jgi:hypothetical protein
MRKVVFGFAALGLLLALSAAKVGAAEGDAQEIKGSAACAMCAFKQGEKCAPCVKVGDKHYTIQCSEKADEATQKLVKSLNGAKEAQNVVIKGVIKENVIIADAVAVAK